VPSAVILAVVSYMLSFSVAKKYATQNRYEIDNSQELLAMGVADLVGSFFGAFPVAGGFARTVRGLKDTRHATSHDLFRVLPVCARRTDSSLPCHVCLPAVQAVNVEAGARSQVSALVSALLVALAVNFLTNTFHYIPMCSLAAIVQVVQRLGRIIHSPRLHSLFRRIGNLPFPCSLINRLAL
jgi:hypothetical protein